MSEFDESDAGEKIELKVDQTTSMKIVKLNPSEPKVGLSIRALKSDDYRTDLEDYSASTGSPEVTLGDHFKRNQKTKR